MNVLVTGGGGMLARAVLDVFEADGHDVLAPTRSELDVTDAAAVDEAVRAAAPDVVVHCAAYTRVDDAEAEPAEALCVNRDGTANVARACAAAGARFVYPSTDYVFDGSASSPYRPDAQPAPINAYGRSKLEGERSAREARDWLVVRTSWLYGAGGRNFVATILDRAGRGEPLRVVADQRGSPTWTRSLAHVLLRLVARGAPSGIYHATNRGETTWYGLAVEAARVAGVDGEIVPTTSAEFPRPAARPRYSVLDCTRTESVVGPIPAWADALAAAIGEGVAV